MKSVTITALDDGQFEVEMAGEAEPMGGEMGAPDMAEDKAEGSLFPTIDEALEAAKGMLGGGEAAAPVMMEGEEEMLSQGFNQVRGTPEQQMGRK